MQRHAGIIRDQQGLETALAELEKLKVRARRVGVTGSREYNPGWHTAIDLRSLLVVSEATARAAALGPLQRGARDRKSTRLNSSHLVISYAVFCLKKKNLKKKKVSVSHLQGTVLQAGR